MNYDFAMKWAEALESGKYKQGRYALFNGEGYCCLGVACEISGLSSFVKEEVFIESGLGNPFIVYVYDNETTTLPESVMKFAEIKDNVCSFDRDSLSAINDSGNTFPQISKIIREKWEEL